MKILRLFELALHAVEFAQVAEAGGDPGVFRAEGNFKNAQDALKDRFGIVEAALEHVEAREIVQAENDLRTLGTQYFFAHDQGGEVVAFGLLVPLL